MTALVWLLAAVVVVLAVLVVGLLRSHATILRALHDAGIDLDPDGPGSAGPVRLPAPTRRGADRDVAAGDAEVRTVAGVPGPAGTTGTRAADVTGRTPSGGTRSVAMGNGSPTLLAFLTTGCSTCAAFWDAFRTAGAHPDGVASLGLPAGLRLVVVTKGPDLESPADVAATAPEGVVTLQSSEAWEDYRIPVAPYFVLVDGGRGVVVGEGAAASWDRVRDLLSRALRDAEAEEGAVDRRSLLTGRAGARSGRARAERIDEGLRSAGIEPGDPRLFHGSEHDPS